MPMIRETVVTTQSRDGVIHIAPIGLIKDGAGWIIAPFKPSTTLDNLRETSYAVANYTDDVRIFAGCLTGRRDWPTQRAEKIPGVYLDAALTHVELEVHSVTEDEVRPKFHCRIVHQATHMPFRGFNRAKAAVLEAAILASRLKMLPRDKILSEIDYLRIAIEKTAGPEELEAWGWIMEKIQTHLGEVETSSSS